MPPRRRRRPQIERTTDPVGDLGRLWQSLDDTDRRRVAEHLIADDIAVLERARAQVSRDGWRATPLTLGVKLGALESMPHTELLAEKFVDAFEGRSPRQIWNLPARHGKSLIGSQWGPTWAFDRDPQIKLALTSYGDELANENSTAVRDLLVAHGDVIETRLRKDRRRMDRFVTDAGGGLIAAGVGSGLTGFGANGLIVDDPFKNWEEAHSEAKRERVWNWYRSVARLRLEQSPRMRELRIPAWIIVIQTRWHEDDLTGKLLAQQAAEGDGGQGWELIRLPAIAEAPNPDALDPMFHTPDLLGRKPGEALAPLLFDVVALLERARDIGSYLTAGMEQQRPAPEEGNDILRSWWKFEEHVPEKFDNGLISWDMKLKDKESGDFVVGQCWGKVGSDYWCIDSMRGQWNLPTVKAAIVLMRLRHPKFRRIVIENTGNGPEVIAELRKGIAGYEVSDDVIGKLGITAEEVPKLNAMMRRGIEGILPENPKGDKRARMRGYTPLIEAGNVHVPENAKWVPAYIDEMSSFPYGKDDQVDATSQALKRLSTGIARARSSKRRVEKPPVSSRTRGSATTGRTKRGATTRTQFGRRSR